MPGQPAKSRQDLASLSFEELLAMGVCECGTPLAKHPPLRAPEPLASWLAERTTPAQLRSGSSLPGVRRMSDDELAYRRAMSASISPRKKAWSLPR